MSAMPYKNDENQRSSVAATKTILLARVENMRHTSKYAINCFTITFHATNLSINTSEGLKSCGAIFFLMSDWLLLTVEPCRLAREMEVCRDIDAVSFIVVVVVSDNDGWGS